MFSTRRGSFSGLEFWLAAITGYFAFSLVWKIEIGGISENECAPCSFRVCQKCSVKGVTPVVSLSKNGFYRDYPWKSLNVVEAEDAKWKMLTKKYRDGMQNDDPRVGINGMWRLEREQVESYIKRVAETFESTYDSSFKLMIRKADPFYGVSYIAQMVDDKDRSIEAFEVRRKFQPNRPLLIDIDHNNPKKIVHIITPLSKVTERFHLFLKRLEDNIYSSGKTSYEKLIFVIFGQVKDEDTKNTQQALHDFQERNPNAVMETTLVSGDFSRAIGLDSGVKMCPPDSLMLFLDVDLNITPEFLNRVRANTIQNKRVVFPIMFSQFDPNVIESYAKSKWGNYNQIQDGFIGKDKGFWIHYAFGVAAMYKSDYFSVGGFPLDIVGWGGEDVSLFKKFIASPTIDVMSTVDPELIHIYHSRACDASLSPDQYRMCIGSLSETIGSQLQLGSLYLQKKSSEYFSDTLFT